MAGHSLHAEYSMADVRKVPYYKPQKGLFGSELKEYKGARDAFRLILKKACHSTGPLRGRSRHPLLPNRFLARRRPRRTRRNVRFLGRHRKPIRQ